MKFNDPCRMLVAGLALALNLNVTWTLLAADAKKAPLQTVKARSTMTIAQVPPAPAPDLPDAPGTTNDLTPIPQLDTKAGAPQPAATPVPAPAPTTPAAPPYGTAPVAPRPSTAPPPRQPLGTHYGEMERLDQLINPQKPAPNSTSTPPEAPPSGEVDRFGFAPPPGTIGQTYKRKTRLIDDKKHPRIGIVDVYLPEDVDVTSPGTKVKWTGKCWRLESDPLIPGVPHIYEIKAQWNENTEPQYRSVRLIMGRIVDLEW